MALKISEVMLERMPLKCPPLEEVANVLSQGLKTSFSEAKVVVVDCPDLTKQPFTLTRKGLGGNPTILESGGVPYLFPIPQRERIYDLKEMANAVGFDSGVVIGAGTGPWPYVGANSEFVANLSFDENNVDNQSRIARVDPETKTYEVLIPPPTETRQAFLGNFFCCEGKPGKVLEVHCRGRTGQDDFVTAIRQTLANHYQNEPVGLGGTFLLKQGKAKHHIMSDFSKVPITSEEQINNWLNFYNMSAPLIAVGTLVSTDPGLDLRVQHFHSFSHHGEAGHYHNDTTPATVEYLAYFNLGQSIARIDRPKETHTMGRN